MSKVRLSMAQFIRKMRLSRGYTQIALAKKLGYSTSQFVSNWESGRSSPPLDALAQLIEILDVDQKEVVDILMNETHEYISRRLKRSKTKSS